MERFLVLHNVEPDISDWCKSQCDFDLQEFDFSKAPMFKRDDGDVVMDIKYLLQQVDTFRYDGVIAVVKGNKLKGIFGVHNGITIGDKRFSIIQSEHQEGVYRELVGIVGNASMKATKKKTDYPQPKYTFEHELLHALAWLRKKRDWLHMYIKIKMYESYKNLFKVKTSSDSSEKAILPDAKKRIIINSGHHLTDSGAVSGNIIERDECMKVRDALLPILESRGYEVLAVPDDLNLSSSIAWANQKAPKLNDALAIDIHFNFLSNNAVGGTEAFHGTSDTSKKITAALSKGISDSLGTRNRGAKPDTQTAVGSLGWIRKTTMWASLVEVAFISNAADMALVQGENGYFKAAKGIADGIDVIFNQTAPEPPQPSPEPVPTPTPVPEPKDLSDFSSKEMLEELLERENTK